MAFRFISWTTSGKKGSFPGRTRPPRRYFTAGRERAGSPRPRGGRGAGLYRRRQRDGTGDMRLSPRAGRSHFGRCRLAAGASPPGTPLGGSPGFPNRPRGGLGSARPAPPRRGVLRRGAAPGSSRPPARRRTAPPPPVTAGRRKDK